MPQAFYPRILPHLQRDHKPHFIAFCTHQRWTLPESARDIVLSCCMHDHEVSLNLDAIVVMPDHVHMIFTPLINEPAREVFSLAEIMDAIKGASAHKINRQLNHQGKVWQTESFDRVLRSSEKLDEKIQYILDNPVRKGLVAQSADYVTVKFMRRSRRLGAEWRCFLLRRRSHNFEPVVFGECDAVRFQHVCTMEAGVPP